MSFELRPSVLPGRKLKPSALISASVLQWLWFWHPDNNLSLEDINKITVTTVAVLAVGQCEFSILHPWHVVVENTTSVCHYLF